MKAIELVFDRYAERWMRKSSYIAVEVKPIDPPMELQLRSKYSMEDMIDMYLPRNANAYCSGFNDGKRAIVQYYKILEEHKKRYPSDAEHHANAMRH